MEVYCGFSALRFGGAAMLNALLLVRIQRRLRTFIIEIHRMRITNVCELFYKRRIPKTSILFVTQLYKNV